MLTHNSQLTVQIEEFQNRLDGLAMNIRDKDIEYGSLDKENEDVIDQYNALVDEYHSKVDRLVDLEKESVEIKVQNAELKKENDTLAQTKYDLEELNRKLLSKKRDMQSFMQQSNMAATDKF